MANSLRTLALSLVAGVVLATPAQAVETLTVAVAANAQYFFADVAQAFSHTHKVKIQPVVASSGKLTAQIRQGAPYDLFLSADMQYPQALSQAGLTIGPPQVYAQGALVLWSNHRALPLDPTLKALSNPRFHRIAIANPKLAPYGAEAERALHHQRLWRTIKPRLVQGDSIAQVNSYVLTGHVQVGFTALSSVMNPHQPSRGHWVAVDPQLYQPIRQGVVQLKRSQSPATQQLYRYLLSPAVRPLLKRHGYLPPP